MFCEVGHILGDYSTVNWATVAHGTGEIYRSVDNEELCKQFC